MFIVPIILLAVLLIILISGNSMKKKGTMAESTFQTLVSVSSIIVTLAAVAAMVMRLRG